MGRGCIRVFTFSYSTVTIVVQYSLDDLIYVIVLPWARVCIYRQSTSAHGITNMFYFSM